MKLGGETNDIPAVKLFVNAFYLFGSVGGFKNRDMRHGSIRKILALNLKTNSGVFTLFQKAARLPTMHTELSLG